MMLRKEILNRIVFSLVLILLPSFAAAQTQGYKDYTVHRGDTLWDICNKELQDPFLWPKVWKENPDIKNPDRIYPGQRIRIPLYLAQKEIVPEIKPAAKPVIKPVLPKEKPEEKRVETVKKAYLVPKDVLIGSGFIGDSDGGVGRITESMTGVTVMAKGDFAYIETDKPATKGDRFFIVRVAEKVIHPKTGHNLGYLIEVLGVAEVVNSEKDSAKIKILTSFSEVTQGDLLRDYYDIEPALAPDNPRKPDLDGCIVATRQLHMVNGNWDIVYLDLGRKDGLEIGDMLATTLQNKHRVRNGVVQVINLRETTSTAIIRKGNIETVKGDGITGITRE
jgi:hypothetical protein